MRRKYNPPGLVIDKGETWKSVRHTLSPTFSAFKMKAVRFLRVLLHLLQEIVVLGFFQMTPIIVRSVEGLVKVFQGHADTNKSFEFFRYTIIIIIVK